MLKTYLLVTTLFGFGFFGQLITDYNEENIEVLEENPIENISENIPEPVQIESEVVVPKDAPNEPIDNPSKPEQTVSWLLAQLVEAEAKGESYQGKVAVAEVVRNRVAHEDYPDTIEEVIYQEGQFQPVDNGAIHNPPSQASISASNEALITDSDNVEGAIFFYNSKTATSRWLDTRPTVKVIENHTFKK